VTFDLLILGTGSGNSILSSAFDDWSVAIVERDAFGGTCINRGCIPTKMFVYVADLVQSVGHGPRLGLDADVHGVRWADLRDRVFGRIDPIAVSGEDYRTNRCPNVTVFKGDGRFVAPNTVAVTGSPNTAEQLVQARQIVVAAGARPMIPDIPGLVETGFYTSDDIMRVDEIPERLIVIGGGFIACELAHVFGSCGAHITIVNRGPDLLRQEDHDVRARFTSRYQSRFDVRLDEQVRSVHRDHAGEIVVDLANSPTVRGDAILIATGRVPNTDELDLAAHGYRLHPDGRLAVDEYLRTSVPGVWSLGDISSPYMLKHVANHEAKVVAHNLTHPDQLRMVNHRHVPHAVFASPQVAAVGLTEDEARQAGLDVVVSTRAYGDTAYGWAMEDEWGFCKVVADRATRQLLGAHVLGPYSSMLVQQLVQGMAFGQTADDLASGQYYIHPALNEVVENALLGLPR
jgi:mycothione reductase